MWLVATPSFAAQRATWLFELHGVPVGTVELSWDRDTGRYRYTSLHLYTRGDERSRKARSAEYGVDCDGREVETGRRFESLTLWRGPLKRGCIDVQEELGTRRGELCVNVARHDRASGTLYGEPFEARWRNGELEALRMGEARFIRVATAKLKAPPDLLAREWTVATGPGALAFEPAPTKQKLRKAARRFDSIEEASALATDIDVDGGCLEHARKFGARARALGRDAFVVHGLVANEAGTRVSPHAWVRVATPHGWADVDPTIKEPVTPSTHLELAVDTGNGDVGRAWLRLFSGELRPTRKGDRLLFRRTSAEK